MNKKLMRIFTVLLLCLLTFGCGKEETIPEEPQVTATADATEIEVTASADASSDAVRVEEESHAAPVIEGVEDLDFLEKETDVDLLENVTAYDFEENEIEVTVDTGDFDINTAGTYTITYAAEDEDGCKTEVPCEVTVDPLVYTSTNGKEIIGATTTNLYVGTAFNALDGVSLSSAFDPAAEIVVDQTGFDVQTEGTYQITYHATNLRGQTVYVYRTITVSPAPVMWGPAGGTVTWDVAGHINQPYLVAVNRLMNTVTVYGKDESGNYTNPVAAFVCSCGKAGYETITGTYTTSNRYEWRQMVDGTYARYAIRISGQILFHSVPYLSTNANDLEYEEYNKLGTAASLGCIRMAVADVYWLYANCPNGFTCVIYDDAALAGPLGKPTPLTIDVTNETLRVWDPTDPQYPAVLAAYQVANPTAAAQTTDPTQTAQTQ